MGLPPTPLSHSTPSFAVIAAVTPPEIDASPFAAALNSAIRSDETERYTGTPPTIKVNRVFTMSSLSVNSLLTFALAVAAILSARFMLNPPSRSMLKCCRSPMPTSSHGTSAKSNSKVPLSPMSKLHCSQDRFIGPCSHNGVLSIFLSHLNSSLGISPEDLVMSYTGIYLSPSNISTRLGV